MDPSRRRLLLTLALAPALPGPLPRGAAAAAAEAVPVVLHAGPGTAPAPPLRYGDAAAPPVLRVPRGLPLRIVLRNALPDPTSLDLHGLRIRPPLGGAGPLGGTATAGASAEIEATPPDSGTFWFHPWILDPSFDATAEGLAGALVVEEPVPPAVDADLVAMLTEPWPPSAADGTAAALRIDGGAAPRHETLRPGSRVRLRLVNASTRRAVTVACRGASPSIVAIDGQPSELFRPRGGAVPMGPGARADLMFDMPAAGSDVSLAVGEARPEDRLLVLRADGEPRGPRPPIAALPANPLLPRAIALETATRVTLVVAGAPGEPVAWSVNGVPGRALPKTPLFRTMRGSPVTLTFRNASAILVGFRVHGHALRLLHDLDDGWEPYWRESVLVPPGATHHAAFVADLSGRWLIESPFFAQAAGGLRTWFEVS